jgi:uncharacterized cupin superfamily protein
VDCAALYRLPHKRHSRSKRTSSLSMSSKIPPSKITNVFEAIKDSSRLAELDISDSLGLADVISVRYTLIPSGNQHDYKVEEKKNLICYILTGDGQITKGDRTADLTSSDCFSFAPSETANSFTLVAGQSSMTVLVVSEILSDPNISSVGILNNKHVGLDLMHC